jgi:hypothetical protein
MDNTKSGEIHQKASEATQPALCKANCGFFGAADKQGYCSVCFKKEVEKQDKKAEPDLKPVPKDNSRLSSTDSTSSSSSDQKVTDAMADLMKPNNGESQPEATNIDLNTSGPSTSGQGHDEDTPPAKKAKKRCGVCKKRLGLTGFECRCGYFYCGIHRYSDKHDCPFDYKKTGRAELSAANPICAGEKIKKL